MTMNLSLNFIFRDSAGSIDQMLATALPIVDEVVAVDTGSEDDTGEKIAVACREAGVPWQILVYEDPHKEFTEAERRDLSRLLGEDDPGEGCGPAPAPWITRFNAARQVALSASTGDNVLWLDTDDVIVNPEKLRTFVDEWMVPRKDGGTLTCTCVRYDYEHASPDADMIEKAQTRVRQYRERIIKREDFRWNPLYPIHETLEPRRPGAKNDDPYAMDFHIHHEGNEHRGDSRRRNLAAIFMWERDGGEMNSRHWRNYFDALRGLGRWGEAIAKADQCLAESEDRQERYMVTLRRGDCLKQLRRLDEALDDYGRAERIIPVFKSAYLAAAQVFLLQERWEDAIIWCDKADCASAEETSRVYNPVSLEYEADLIRAQAHESLNEYAEAIPCWEHVREATPENEWIKSRLARCREAERCKGLYYATMSLYDAIPKEDGQALLALAPKEIRHFPVITDIRAPARPADKPSVVIFCGQTPNAWGWRGNEYGVGGSEDAAIAMSKQLAERGFHVEVYGNIPLGEMGRDPHGVWWMPFHAYPEDPAPDVYISWRQIRAIEFGERAKVNLLWLQDIPHPEWYTPEAVAMLDGILCISELQASRLPAHAQNKVIITGNGIEPSEIVSGPNDPKKFVYFSCPIRGLKELFSTWPAIIEYIPDATLDVYYGFRDTYMKIARQSPHYQSYKDEVLGMLKELGGQGVTWHGMVGVPELHKALAGSGFWLFPSSFPESYCTNAAKAQAMGCIPVTSGWAGSSIPEVAKYDLGISTPVEEPVNKSPQGLGRWLEAVKEAYDVPAKKQAAYRKEMKAWALKHLCWDKRGTQWNTLIRGLLRNKREAGSTPSHSSETRLEPDETS